VTLAELAADTPDLSLLVRALTATGLLPIIADPAANLTAFPPVNGAFVRLAVTLGYDGEAADVDAAYDYIVGALTKLGAGNPLPLLATVLTYHVLPVRLNSTDLVAAGPLTTLEGGTLAVSADLRVVDRAPGVPNARIVQADVALANGVTHLVDRVLLPLPLGAARRLPPPCAVTLAQLAGATPELSTLLRALAATGLTQLIANPAGSLTVFPPTNAAFAALAETLGYRRAAAADGVAADGAADGDDDDDDDADAVFDFLLAALTRLGGGDPLPLLTTILTYHVLPVRRLAAEIVGAGPLVTLRGSVLAVTPDLRVVDLAPGVADAVLVEADVETSNGVAHLVSRVLLPLPLWPVASVPVA